MVICPRCNQGWVAIERNFEKKQFIFATNVNQCAR